MHAYVILWHMKIACDATKVEILIVTYVELPGHDTAADAVTRARKHGRLDGKLSSPVQLHWPVSSHTLHGLQGHFTGGAVRLLRCLLKRVLEMLHQLAAMLMAVASCLHCVRHCLWHGLVLGDDAQKCIGWWLRPPAASSPADR
jgi:hypothetical protein